jgi:hypothetical protein
MWLSGDYMLTDLGSEQGVILNGRKIEVESKVVIGDVVTIGSVKIDVLALGASAAELFQTATTTPPVLNKKGPKPPKVPGVYDPDSMLDVDDAEDRLPSFFDQGYQASEKDEPVRLDDTELTSPVNSMYIEEKQVESSISHVERVSETIEQPESKAPFTAPQTRPPVVESKSTPSPGSQHDTTGVSSSSNIDKSSPQLFSPKKGRPSGDVLEVVSYWGDTVLEVELFHPSFKGFEHPTIGDLPKAHFLSGIKMVPRFNL